MFNPNNERDKKTIDVFQKLFKMNPNDFKSNDPEFMKILQNYIFGDIFETGELTIKERELIKAIL